MLAMLAMLADVCTAKHQTSCVHCQGTGRGNSTLPEWLRNDELNPPRVWHVKPRSYFLARQAGCDATKRVDETRASWPLWFSGCPLSTWSMSSLLQAGSGSCGLAISCTDLEMTTPVLCCACFCWMTLWNYNPYHVAHHFPWDNCDPAGHRSPTSRRFSIFSPCRSVPATSSRRLGSPKSVAVDHLKENMLEGPTEWCRYTT